MVLHVKRPHTTTCVQLLVRGVCVLTLRTQLASSYYYGISVLMLVSDVCVLILIYIYRTHPRKHAHTHSYKTASAADRSWLGFFKFFFVGAQLRTLQDNLKTAELTIKNDLEESKARMNL
jgi:hypothetical protein